MLSVQNIFSSSHNLLRRKQSNYFSSGVSTKTHHIESEDRIIEALDVGDSGVSIFGVIDGHGGGDCAAYISKALPQVIISEANKRQLRSSLLNDDSWGVVLEDAFEKVSNDWDNKGTVASGAVATLVLVSKRTCLIAHA